MRWLKGISNIFGFHHRTTKSEIKSILPKLGITKVLLNNPLNNIRNFNSSIGGILPFWEWFLWYVSVTLYWETIIWAPELNLSGTKSSWTPQLPLVSSTVSLADAGHLTATIWSAAKCRSDPADPLAPSPSTATLGKIPQKIPECRRKIAGFTLIVSKSVKCSRPGQLGLASVTHTSPPHVAEREWRGIVRGMCYSHWFDTLQLK